jgi:D-alanine-D-alanine ligase
MTNRAKKLTVAVIHGGRSGEHEISLLSARSIMDALDKEKYEVLPVFVGKDGNWSVDGEVRLLAPDAQGGRLLNAYGSVAESFDVAFPIIHGTDGEDGALQGLLELVSVPYVGGGVLGSAIGMDKVMQKRVLRDAKIPVTAWTDFRMHEWEADPEAVVSLVEVSIGYPNFVKPVSLGSSVGISKAHHRQELLDAIELALRVDTHVIVEKAVPSAREIECAALGNVDHAISVFGEIFPSNEFYDYAAKYLDGKSTTALPADLPAAMTEKLQGMAERACAVLNVEGMARVDFLVSKDSGEAYLNEINTLPGFTSISMYPKLWEASGIAYPALLDRLITLALARYEEREGLERDFTTL